jgi:hypothetical protein
MTTQPTWTKTNVKGTLSLVDKGQGTVELHLNDDRLKIYGCKATIFGNAKGTRYFMGTRYGLTPAEYKAAKAFVDAARDKTPAPKSFKLNPQWVAYNNGINEGGEGYNPYPQYL